MKEYIEKLDHTLCLNHNEGNLKYNIDNEYHIDCVDMNEMLDCVDKVKNSMEVLDILIKYHSDFIEVKVNNACLVLYGGAKYGMPKEYINYDEYQKMVDSVYFLNYNDGVSS